MMYNWIGNCSVYIAIITFIFGIAFMQQTAFLGIGIVVFIASFLTCYACFRSSKWEMDKMEAIRIPIRQRLGDIKHNAVDNMIKNAILASVVNQNTGNSTTGNIPYNTAYQPMNSAPTPPYQPTNPAQLFVPTSENNPAVNTVMPGAGMVFCKNCGAQNRPNIKFCGNCGQKVE